MTKFQIQSKDNQWCVHPVLFGRSSRSDAENHTGKNASTRFDEQKTDKKQTTRDKPVIQQREKTQGWSKP